VDILATPSGLNAHYTPAALAAELPGSVRLRADTGRAGSARLGLVTAGHARGLTRRWGRHDCTA